MSSLVALTCREVEWTGGIHDGLDQRWWAFLDQCGVTPVLLPNDPSAARELLHRIQPVGLILTGGGDVGELSGTFGPRDAVESLSMDWARTSGKPVLGVCRGMQKLLAVEGIAMTRVAGHAASRHRIVGAGVDREVNSYHHYAPRGIGPYTVRAAALDGVVEWIADEHSKRTGIMWHPEREPVFAQADLDLVRNALYA